MKTQKLSLAILAIIGCLSLNAAFALRADSCPFPLSVPLPTSLPADCEFGFADSLIEWVGTATFQSPKAQQCTVTNITSSVEYIDLQYELPQNLNGNIFCSKAVQNVGLSISANSSLTFNIPACASTYSSQYDNIININRANSNGIIWQPSPNDQLPENGFRITCQDAS